MPEREPLRSQGDFVIDVESSDQPGPYQFYSTRFGTPFQSTKSGDFVVRTGETERFRIANNGTVTGLTGLPFQQPLGIFNVKDAAYGAKGDDVTNDTAAIQAAINACELAGGGIVYFPGGTYKTSSPLLITSDNVALLGSGRGTAFNPPSGTLGPCVIKPTSGFVGSAVVNIAQSSPTRSLRGIQLSGFAISGFGVPSGVAGIYAEINSSLVEEIYVAGVTGSAYHFGGHATDGCFNVISRNFANSIGGDAFTFDIDAPDNLVSENNTFTIGGNGINTAAPGLKIEGNHLLAITGAAITGNPYDTKVLDNRIEDCNGGIYFSGTNGGGGFVIVGNKIWNCSLTTDNTLDSINVTASVTTHGGTILGNSFYTNRGAINGGSTGAYNRARYHINIASSNIQDVAIGPNSYLGYDNALSSYGTAAINDDGSRTQIAPIVLARSAIAASHTGDTNETTLASVTVPGGLMGKKGTLKVWTLWSVPSNADNKTAKVKLSTTAFFNLTVTTVVELQANTQITNRGAQNSQVSPTGAQAGPGTAVNPVVTAAIDTSTDQTLAITGQLAVNTDTITLEAYRVEIVQ